MSTNPRGVWFSVSVGLTVALVLAGFLASYYYLQFSSVEANYRETLASLDKVSYQVNVLINYGNGTLQWLNNTRIPVGWNAFNATAANASLDAPYFPEFTSHFIKAINGVGLVKDQAQKDWFWTFWVWDTSTKDWKLSEVGADQVILTGGQIVAWNYADTSNWPNVQKPT